MIDTQSQQPIQRPSTRSTLVQPSANSATNNNPPSPSRGPRPNVATRSSPRKTSAVRWLRAVVGQASVPTNLNESNANDGSPILYHDDNGNTKDHTVESDHLHENEEDVCSCSLSKDNKIKIISSLNNNNGGSSISSKPGISGKQALSTNSTSPYIISLSTSRQHSNHHVLT